MMSSELPFFGQVDLTRLDEYYRIDTEFNGFTLQLDLNFEGKSITGEQYQNIKSFLEKISEFDIRNKKGIERDYRDEGETADYIAFYMDEFDEDELSRIIGSNNMKDSKEKQLLLKLRLVRVGLYPDARFDSNRYGVFDYSIDWSQFVSSSYAL